MSIWVNINLHYINPSIIQLRGNDCYETQSVGYRYIIKIRTHLEGNITIINHTMVIIINLVLHCCGFFFNGY